MKILNWNKEKNIKLQEERNISFEDIVFQIQMGNILDKVEHHAKPNQQIYIIEFNDYAYLVPFVETETEIFLKTIIPSRKATKKYLKGEKDE